jgi:hypothetical protein
VAFPSGLVTVPSGLKAFPSGLATVPSGVAAALGSAAAPVGGVAASVGGVVRRGVISSATAWRVVACRDDGPFARSADRGRSGVDGAGGRAGVVFGGEWAAGGAITSTADSTRSSTPSAGTEMSACAGPSSMLSARYAPIVAPASTANRINRPGKARQVAGTGADKSTTGLWSPEEPATELFTRGTDANTERSVLQSGITRQNRTCGEIVATSARCRHGSPASPVRSAARRRITASPTPRPAC